MKLAACLVLVALAGCEGNATREPGLTPPGLTREIARVYCGQVTRCCSAEDKLRLSEGLRQAMAAGTCPSFDPLLEYLDDELNLGRVKSAVEAGRARYDADLGRACVRALEGLSCEHWSATLAGAQAALPAPCRDMVRGTLPLGAACELNREFECESASCGGALDGTAGDAKVCVSAPGPGQICPARCEDVLDCSARCREGVCTVEGVCADSATVPRAQSFCSP